MEIFYLWGLFIDWQKVISEKEVEKELSVKVLLLPLRSVLEIFYLWGLFNDWQILEKEEESIKWEGFYYENTLLG